MNPLNMLATPPDTRENYQVPPNAVLSAMPCEYFIVTHGDDRGRETQSLVMKVGNNYYLDKASWRWVAALEKLDPKVVKEIEAKTLRPVTKEETPSTLQVPADKVTL